MSTTCGKFVANATSGNCFVGTGNTFIVDYEGNVTCTSITATGASTNQIVTKTGVVAGAGATTIFAATLSASSTFNGQIVVTGVSTTNVAGGAVGDVTFTARALLSVGRNAADAAYASISAAELLSAVDPTAAGLITGVALATSIAAGVVTVTAALTEATANETFTVKTLITGVETGTVTYA
jgi:hypothetical protein